MIDEKIILDVMLTSADHCDAAKDKIDELAQNGILRQSDSSLITDLMATSIGVIVRGLELATDPNPGAMLMCRFILIDEIINASVDGSKKAIETSTEVWRMALGDDFASEYKEREIVHSIEIHKLFRIYLDDALESLFEIRRQQLLKENKGGDFNDRAH